jgi:hypothetical protein
LSREGRDEPEFIVPVPADSAPIGCATLRRCRAGGVEDLHDCGAEANVDVAAGELVGDAVEVALDLDVVVDADAGYPVRGGLFAPESARSDGEFRVLAARPNERQANSLSRSARRSTSSSGSPPSG